MKYTKIAIIALLVVFICSGFSKKKEKEVYAFGVSASFVDTVVYYTEIQLLDSVKLDKKDFLPQRELYSYQLKNHLEYQKGLPNRTCMIYFSSNKKKLEKEQSKLIAKYKKRKSVSMEKIDKADFSFKKPEE